MEHPFSPGQAWKALSVAPESRRSAPPRTAPHSQDSFNKT